MILIQGYHLSSFLAEVAQFNSSEIKSFLNTSGDFWSVQL